MAFICGPDDGQPLLRLRRQTVVRHRNHLVAHANLTGFEHSRGDATVPPHGVEPAFSQRFFHAAAGVTRTGILQQCRSQAEGLVLQREQVQPRDHHIASQVRWGQSVEPGHGTNRVDVFRLNERHLTLATAREGMAVAIESSADLNRGLFNLVNRLSAPRREANPLHRALLRDGVQ